MVVTRRSIFAVTFVGVLADCATVPDGPGVAVMPVPGKPFDLFVAEGRKCRQFAQRSIGTTASLAATESAVKSIAVGTSLGAVAGIRWRGPKWRRIGCRYRDAGWRSDGFGCVAL